MKRRDVLLAGLGILVIWQALALLVNRPILPMPLMVLEIFFTDFFGGLFELLKQIGSGEPLRFSELDGLLIHFLVSLWRVMAGMLLSVMTAVPAGLALGGSKSLNRIFSPVIYLLYPIPKVVFVPIVLLFLGIGDLAKIVVIFLILFFQIAVLVRDQAAGLPTQLLQSLRSLGAGRRALFRFVYLPASLPAILTALRQSIGTAVAVLYIAELFATRKGLGYYIYYQGSTLLDYPAMYAGVLAMSLLGLGLYFTVDWMEKWLCPWKFVG